jgi:tight adherence protein C
MNMGMVVPVTAGVAAGGGLTLMVAQLLPKGPPELRSAVERLNSPLQESTALSVPGAETIQGRSSALPPGLLQWIGHSGLVRAMPEDLAILGRSNEVHVAKKVTAGLVGVLVVPTLVALLTVAKVRVPVELPVGATLLIGVICFFGPDMEARKKAAEARVVFHKVLHGYLVNVALERRANRGIVQALEEAASVGDSWVLARIRATLLAAQMSNQTPWQALEELGASLGVMHLVEAAQTLRSASEEGTAVFARLVAQADSLGDAVLSEERSLANARSERLVFPVSALTVVILAIMMYPLLARLSGQVP